MTTTLLIDADIFAYEAAAAYEERFEFDGIISIKLKGTLKDATDSACERIDEIARYLKADSVIVNLSCPTAECWRKDVLPTYKWQRKPTAKPLMLLDVKDHLRQAYLTYEKPRMEADDVMGILSTHPTLIAGKKIIVSIDKDMESIPGWLFNPRKDKRPRLVDVRDADLYHLYQTLTGDATDGYKGCPSIGPKGAATILAEYHASYGSPFAVDGWAAVVAAYVSKGFTAADALVQARVARICRHTDYDYKRKEVKLWTPAR